MLSGSRDVLLEFVDGGGSARTLWARVEHAGTERVVLRSLPDHAADQVPDVGQRIRLRIEPEAEAAVALVIERGSPESRLVISRPTRIIRQSRRRFYRIDVDLHAETSSGPCRVWNLSGSGCLLTLLAGSPLPPVGTDLELRLPVPGVPAPLHIRARVVRQFLPNVGSPRLGVDFVQLKRREEDAIIRYVFARQTELLRRGLLPTDPTTGPSLR